MLPTTANHSMVVITGVKSKQILGRSRETARLKDTDVDFIK